MPGLILKGPNMLKRISIVAAMAAGLAACATNPAPLPGPSPTPTPEPAAPAATAPILNLAATSQWTAEERLLPQQPILALVGQSGQLSEPVGFSMTCNPDDGKITARLGRQPSNRVGQSATYRLRLGAEARQVNGKFEASGRPTDSDFVFGLDSPTLRSMAGADMFSMITDGGEVQWSFVKDPATQVQAKYVGSTKNLATESQAYLVFCNPK